MRRRRDRAVVERLAERRELRAQLRRGVGKSAQVLQLLGRERSALRRIARERARIVPGEGDIARDALERMGIDRQHAERHFRRLRIAVDVRADRALHGCRRCVQALLQRAVELLHGVEHLAVSVAVIGVHGRLAAVGVRAAGDQADRERRDERRSVGNDEHARFFLHSKPPLPD